MQNTSDFRSSATSARGVLWTLLAKDWRFFRVPTAALLIVTGLWLAYASWVLLFYLCLPGMEFLRAMDLIDTTAAYDDGRHRNVADLLFCG
jgi:hypothetical protein